MPQLLYAVTADTSKFDQAMTHARDVAVARGGEMVQQFRRVSRELDDATGASERFGAGLGTGVRAIAALAGIVVAYKAIAAGIRAAGDEIERYVKLQQQAREVGLSVGTVDQFQRIAQRMHVEVETFDRILSEIRSSTKSGFLDRGSNAEDAFEEFSKYTPEGTADRFRFARDAQNGEAQFRLILETIRQINAEWGSIAAQDFAGRISKSLADGIRSGSIEIDALIDKLNSVEQTTGINEQAARAEDLTKRLATATQEIDAFLAISRALVEIGYQAKAAWVWIVEDFAKGARAANDLVNILRNMPGAGVVSQIIKPDWVRREDAMTSLRQGLGSGQRGATTLNPFGGEFQGLPNETAPLPPPRPGRLTDQSIERTPAQTAETFNAIETFVNGLERSSAALRAEADAAGLSNTERQISIDLARARAIASQNDLELTDAQIKKIREYSTASAQARDRISEINAAQQRAAETARFFGQAISDSFADAILDGKKLTDILDDVYRQLMRASIQAILMGSGPMASLFGTAAPAGATGAGSVGGLLGGITSLFGGRALGGSVSGGGTYLVGESGPELLRMGRSGIVTPAPIGQMARGGSGGVQIIDQRTNAPPIEQSTGSGGDMRLVIRDLDMAMNARQASIGRIPHTRRG